MITCWRFCAPLIVIDLRVSPFTPLALLLIDYLHVRQLWPLKPEPEYECNTRATDSGAMQGYVPHGSNALPSLPVTRQLYEYVLVNCPNRSTPSKPLFCDLISATRTRLARVPCSNISALNSYRAVLQLHVLYLVLTNVSLRLEGLMRFASTAPLCL
jgi:hypothetical protein